VTALADMGLAWVCAGCFALTVVSAVLPWVNAEVIVLALPAVAPSRPALFLLVLIATAGQMTGKLAVYWAGRGGAAIPSPRVARAVERWQPRFAASRRSAAGLVFLSSAIGIPPFFVVTLLAGALRMELLPFLAAGASGRLVRFGALAVVPALVLEAP
jgi:membrane protein YqaA with SNARE-associated domain